MSPVILMPDDSILCVELFRNCYVFPVSVEGYGQMLV